MVYIRTAATALLSGIIMPLYIYPGDGCTAWQPLFTAISDHTDLPFYVIVNPASGPGNATTPDSNYRACIPSLRPSSNPNVKVLGYVATGFGTGNPTSTKINGDVDLYAGWGNAYRPDGIFFDEASLSTSTNDLTNYGNYATHVRSNSWHQAGEGYVAFNPGVAPASTSYFGFADMVVTIEKFYANYNHNNLIISATSPASQQAVILHDAPSIPPASDINQLVMQDHIGAVYITDIPQDSTTNFNPYGAFPTHWDDFVDAVEDAQP